MRPSNEFPPEGRLALPVELILNGTAKDFTLDVRSIRTLQQTMIVRAVWFDVTNVIPLNKSNIQLSAIGFGSILLPVSPSQGIITLPCTSPAVILIHTINNGGFPDGKLRLVFFNYDADPYEVDGISTH